MHGDKRKLTMDSIERAVRGTVCPACYQRPVGSETMGNDHPRSCQPQCPIFLNLPKLYKIAVHDVTHPEEMDKAIKETICPSCAVSPTAGEFCPEFSARTCPLSRFSAEVVLLIETLRQWQHRTTGSCSI